MIKEMAMLKILLLGLLFIFWVFKDLLKKSK